MNALKQAKTDLIQIISGKVMRITGVQLHEKQRAMVEARLKKRISDLGFAGIDEYEVYFFQHETAEVEHLVSLLTTHHTFFFREFSHFEYLAQTILPALIPIARKRADKTIRIWSAACSRGQEVYSIAMLLSHALKSLAPDLKVFILGTDVDPKSVKIAENGVYPRREISEAPLMYLADHWVRGTGEISEFAKVKPSLRNLVKFETLNLLGLNQAKLSNSFSQKFDVIFCRNVFIYFTPEQIKQTTTELIKHLSDDGNLFLGLSETLNGLNLPLKSQGPAIYRRHKVESSIVAPTPVILSKASPLRVFCVDDSASIHTLMKQILKKEDGFEIVGIAMNGKEAAEKLKTVGPVDVMTLDIHMPEVTGVEYMERHFGAGHPPVVMITSVSRDNAELAFRSLQLGASDFIEKPALNNLGERGDEIRAKLKAAVKAKKASLSLKLEKDFRRSSILTEPELKARFLIAGLSDIKKVSEFIFGFGSAEGVQPPLYIFVEGALEALPMLAQKLSASSGKVVLHLDLYTKALAPGQIGVLDVKRHFDLAKSFHASHVVSVCVYGEVSTHFAKRLGALPNAQVLLEDLGEKKGAEALQARAQDIFPATSFAYVSGEFFGKKK